MDVNTIGKQLLFSTVKITAWLPAGVGHGTGFIVELASVAGQQSVPVVITNKHVVEGATKLSFRLIARTPGEKNPKLGEAHDFVVDPSDVTFVGHPNPAIDIAAVPLGLIVKDKFPEVFYCPIPKVCMPTVEDGRRHDAIEEVTFVGYPNGWADEAHHTPIVRRGLTATPMSLRFGGNPVYLVDGSVFGGSSGSPVLLFNQGSYSNGQGGLVVGTRFQLVGIMAQTLVRNSQLPLAVSTLPHVKVAQEMNLGVAFNWEAIAETISALEKAYGIQHATPAAEAAVAQPE